MLVLWCRRRVQQSTYHKIASLAIRMARTAALAWPCDWAGAGLDG